MINEVYRFLLQVFPDIGEVYRFHLVLEVYLFHRRPIRYTRPGSRQRFFPRGAARYTDPVTVACCAAHDDDHDGYDDGMTRKINVREG